MLITFRGKCTHVEELLNKLHYFSFLCSQKYSCCFAQLKLGHSCHMDCFTDVLTTFLVLGTFQLRCCLCRVRELSDLIKNILICVLKMNRGLGFGTTRGWVIIDRIFILGWTNPLTTFLSIVSFRNSPTNNLLFPMTIAVWLVYSDPTIWQKTDQKINVNYSKGKFMFLWLMVTYIVGHCRQVCLKTKDICHKSQVKLTVKHCKKRKKHF